MQNNIKYYSTSAKDIKYSAKYKKDYMLTDIQKEALLGIILKPLTLLDYIVHLLKIR